MESDENVMDVGQPILDIDSLPDLAEPFLAVAKSVHDIHRQAVMEYTPVVNAILRSCCQDTQHIERTLDGLLDFCANNDALLLYKKLCRHYYGIDPVAGLLISDKRFTFQYGYVEGRFKLPNNRGAWPAFWLLGDDPTKANQDEAHQWGPEIDIFEFFGHCPTKHSAGIIARDKEEYRFHFGYNEVLPPRGERDGITSGSVGSRFPMARQCRVRRRRRRCSRCCPQA